MNSIIWNIASPVYTFPPTGICAGALPQSHDKVCIILLIPGTRPNPNGRKLRHVRYRLYFGWYYGELDTLGPFLDRYHALHPDVPLFISEYGAGSDRRVHSLRPERFDFSTEYQQRFHEETFGQILARQWLVGSAVWAQFDFGSDFRQDTIFGINQKGLWY